MVLAGRARWSGDGVKRVIERGHGLFGNGVPVGNWVGASGGRGGERRGYRGTVGNSQGRKRWWDCRAEIVNWIG